MFRPFRKGGGVKPDVGLLDDIEFVKNGDKLTKIEAERVSDFGQDLCLDIGVGTDNSDGFTTVDIDGSCKPDFVGDIRCLFAPSEFYQDQLDNYPDMQLLAQKKFMLIRAKHVIEHIEWLYLPTLFEWFSKMLNKGGILIIDTPNLEYIAKMYILNLDKQLADEPVSFPLDEHPDIDDSVPENMQRWINFKIMSGCSPGDYHHSCLDTVLLVHYFKRGGFADPVIYNGSSLRAIAYKSSEGPTKNLDDLIADIVNGGR